MTSRSEGVSGGRPVLEISNLRVEIGREDEITYVLNGIDLVLDGGQTLGVLGESGSGKSTLARCITGSIHRVPAARMSGKLKFGDLDVLAASEAERRQLRGLQIGLIPQDALAALNPVRRVGSQIAELFTWHGIADRKEARARTIELLGAVGIPGPSARYHSFPHELSGGMRQRIAIAMAIALRPRLIIADEPTTALDVTVQAEILELLGSLVEANNLALIFITHDLPVLSEIVSSVAVMYAGRIVESGELTEVLDSPSHPYTEKMIQAVPGGSRHHMQLSSIGGRPPDLRERMPGCAFAPRCDLAIPICQDGEPPPLYHVSGEHGSACHRYLDLIESRQVK